MDLILTGRRINAGEAHAFGLVSRIVEDDLLMSTAAEIAQRVASFSKPAVMLARDAVNRAEGAALSEGLLFERRVFQSLFATHDQKEGMQAFLEKRRPEFTGT
jgi:enoyl-CoA hydratase